jgi:hypothetical protein
MASQVEIVNRALTALGSERITSLSDNTKQAKTASAIWDTIVDGLLRAYRWNFSIKRDSLAALVSTPEWGFEFEYQLPADCILLLQVGEYFVDRTAANYRDADDSPWMIEGRKILTDLDAPLSIRYVGSVADTNDYDAMFTEALIAKLSMEMAEPLTQSATKRQLAKADYDSAIRLAIRSNSIENPSMSLPDSSWILGRI